MIRRVWWLLEILQHQNRSIGLSLLNCFTLPGHIWLLFSAARTGSVHSNKLGLDKNHNFNNTATIFIVVRNHLWCVSFQTNTEIATLRSCRVAPITGPSFQQIGFLSGPGCTACQHVVVILHISVANSLTFCPWDEVLRRLSSLNLDKKFKSLIFWVERSIMKL